VFHMCVWVEIVCLGSELGKCVWKSVLGKCVQIVCLGIEKVCSNCVFGKYVPNVSLGSELEMCVWVVSWESVFGKCAGEVCSNCVFGSVFEMCVWVVSWKCVFG